MRRPLLLACASLLTLATGLEAREIYVSNEKGNSITIIDDDTIEILDTASRKIVGTLPSGPDPELMDLSPDGAVIYVANEDDNMVTVVDTQAYEVAKYLLVGQRVWQLAFSPDEKFLYTTNGVSNDISVIDVEQLGVVKSITVGSYPWGVAVKD